MGRAVLWDAVLRDGPRPRCTRGAVPPHPGVTRKETLSSAAPRCPAALPPAATALENRGGAKRGPESIAAPGVHRTVGAELKDLSVP